MCYTTVHRCATLQLIDVVHYSTLMIYGTVQQLYVCLCAKRQLANVDDSASVDMGWWVHSKGHKSLSDKRTQLWEK